MNHVIFILTGLLTGFCIVRMVMMMRANERLTKENDGLRKMLDRVNKYVDPGYIDSLDSACMVATENEQLLAFCAKFKHALRYPSSELPDFIKQLDEILAKAKH